MKAGVGVGCCEDEAVAFASLAGDVVVKEIDRNLDLLGLSSNNCGGSSGDIPTDC